MINSYDNNCYTSDQNMLIVVPTSAQPSSFALRLQKGENVAFAYRSLHVANDGPVAFVQKLHANLGTLALRTGAADDLGDASQLNLVHGGSKESALISLVIETMGLREEGENQIANLSSKKKRWQRKQKSTLPQNTAFSF